jgi:hypothetical protein
MEPRMANALPIKRRMQWLSWPDDGGSTDRLPPASAGEKRVTLGR